MNSDFESKKLYYYHDWLDLFNYYESTDLNEQLYNNIIKQNLGDKEVSLINFKKALICFINHYLNYQFKRYTKVVNLLLEFNDINQISRETIKIKNNLKYLTFFNQLAFLDKTFKNELNESLKENIDLFYKQLLDKVKEQTIENEYAFEIYYILNKFKFSF